MDSMRSLNTSLPGNSPSKQQVPEPPEQLLSAFKAAALSVTKLYKTAAADQARARSGGYQDALDELLAFLDKQDIGLTDGEGWRIRRWATERLDGREGASQQVESDDETGQAERASSPPVERAQTAQSAAQSAAQISTRSGSPTRVEPTPPVNLPSGPENQSTILPPTGTFTFRSTVQYPQDADMGLSGLDISDSSRGQPIDATIVSHRSQSPSASITFTRPTRTTSRLNSQATRSNAKATSALGRGAGQKRKINLGEFFDIGNLGHGKDGFSGEARGDDLPEISRRSWHSAAHRYPERHGVLEGGFTSSIGRSNTYDLMMRYIEKDLDDETSQDGIRRYSGHFWASAARRQVFMAPSSLLIIWPS